MTSSRSQLPRTAGNLRTALFGVAIFGAFVNILMLTGAFYMLQVYDRVIPSRSVPTLIGLSALAIGLYAGLGFFDFIRGRILQRLGRAFDEKISPLLIPHLVRSAVSPNGDTGTQTLRDLDQVRGFFSSGSPAVLFDLPWLPVYLAICYVLHPLIGLAAIIGAVVLASLTLITDAVNRSALRDVSDHAARRSALAEASRLNAEALRAMGMTNRFGLMWQLSNRAYLVSHDRASDIVAGLGGVSRTFRLALQSGVLGLGAFLAIQGEASPGIMIAASIIAARALAPLEMAIAHWKTIVGARQSWKRLKGLVGDQQAVEDRLQLHPPAHDLSLENVSVRPPGAALDVVKGLSLTLQAGTALALVGPSGSGKSTIARTLLGLWRPTHGKVRLDGAALDQWDDEALGRYVGYLPQDMELLEGTVAQNIARFDPEASSERIISAAEAAGIHRLILSLPFGYDTRIASGGGGLSAGQRQRVALARALYGDPFLVVLDEPNSNLDGEGEAALQTAIEGVRKRGGIVVVVAHRPSALAAVNLVALIKDGRMQAFGPKEEVLKQVLRPVPPPAPMEAA